MRALPRQFAPVAVDPALVAKGEQMNPAVVDEVADALLPGDDAIDGIEWRIDNNIEAEGLVNKPVAVMNGLPGQSHPEIAAVTLQHPYRA